MDFTELYKQTSQLCSFSPRTGRFLSCVVQHRLVVRDAQTLQIIQLFQCKLGPIMYIEWSPDEELLLCAGGFQQKKHEGFLGGSSDGGGWIQVFRLFPADTDGFMPLKESKESLDTLNSSSKNAKAKAPPKTSKPNSVSIEKNPHLVATITAGAAGLVRCQFAPDGRHVLSWSEFQLRLTIWSLTDPSTVYYIKCPKFHQRGFSFRTDGRYMAYAERIDSKDYVGVVDTRSWHMVKRFPLPTQDVYDLAWSADGRYLACWEHPIDFKVHILTPDGRCVKSVLPTDVASLGVRTVSWSPSSQLLAVGSLDGKVRCLDHYTWRPLIEFAHSSTVTDRSLDVFMEQDLADSNPILRDSALEDRLTGSSLVRAKVHYKVIRPPIQLPTPKSAKDEKDPFKMGISLLEWNSDGKLLLVKNDATPAVLYVYSVYDMKLTSVMVQLSNVRKVAWNPMKPNQLAFCCTCSSAIYLWSGYGCDSVEIPALNFEVHSLKWSPDGESLILMDRDKFCLAFPLTTTI